MAILYMTGTLYLLLPLTGAGTFTRGGVIFLALLFTALKALSEPVSFSMSLRSFIELTTSLQ